MILEIVILSTILILNIFIFIGTLNAQSENGSKKRKLFVGMIIGIILWVLSILITDVFYKNIKVSLIASRGSFAATAFISIFYILFSSSFNVYISKIEKVIIKILILLSIIGIFISFSSYIVESVEVIENRFLKSTFGTLYYPYGVYILSSFAFPSLLLFRSYIKEQNNALKMQILYIFLGSVLSITFSLITNILFPILNIGEIRYLGPFSLVFFLSFTYYAIIRYRFLSIRFILGKAVYFLSISLLPYVTFFGVYYLQDKLWGSIFNVGAIITGLFLSGLFVYVFFNAKTSIGKLINRAIIYPYFDPEEVRNEFIRNISKELGIDKLGSITISLFMKYLNIDKCGLVIFGKGNKNLIYKDIHGFEYQNYNDLEKLMNSKKYFNNDSTEQIIILDELQQKYDFIEDKSLLNLVKSISNAKIEIIVPISIKSKLNGLLLLGEKKNGNAYTIDDMDFIESIIANASVALGRALLYKEVENFNLTLKQRVDDQTKELANKVEALEEARRKERDMIDILGHELRTPLSIIKSGFAYLDILFNKEIKSKLDSDINNKLIIYNDRINENIEREIKLIDNLLGSTKIDKGKLELQKEEVDIIDVIEDGIIGQKKKAEKTELYLRFNKPENSEKYPRILADRARIQEVMDNLLSNGVKYTQKGGVTIDIGNDGNFVTVHVKDTGIGIPKVDIPNLGKKFYRVGQYTEGSLERDLKMVRSGGSGLGLYVTYGLVKAHGGKIWVDSEIGKGSVFHFSIPIYKGQMNTQKNKRDIEKDIFKREGLKTNNNSN